MGRFNAALMFRPPQGWERLVLRNQGLELATFRLYRFWARTEWRRCFWSSIRIDSDALEYTGRAEELLLGFALAFLVMAPAVIVYCGVIESVQPEDPAFAILIALSCLVFVYVIALARYWARGYLLASTLWRGIYAGQDGSAFVYALRYTVWAVAFLLTAGYSLPWACADLARYRLRHTTWGNYRGSFAGEARQVWPSWPMTWAINILPLYAAAVWVIAAGNWNPMALQHSLEDAFDGILRGEVMAVLYWLMASLWLIPCCSHLYTRWLKWYLGGIAVGPMRFRCSMPQQEADRRIFKGILLAQALCILVVVAIFGLDGSSLEVLSELGYTEFVWLCSGLFAMAWAAFGYVVVRFIHVPLADFIIGHTSIEGLSAAGTAVQAAAPRRRRGEGLADIAHVAL